MRSVAIYVEGGGTAHGKAKLRRGFNRFFSSVSRPHDRTMRWGIIPCGSKSETIKDFLDGVANEPDRFNILLTDADEEVTGTPHQHFQKQLPGTDWSSVDADALHLMVQIMETWIVADPDGLATVYGKKFKASALPPSHDLERISKADIEGALAKATKDTARGSYHKINHIEDVLSALDPMKVRKHCKHCDALFLVLERHVGGR